MREVILTGIPEGYSKEKYVLFGISNFQHHEELFEHFGGDLNHDYIISIEDNIRFGKLTSDHALYTLVELSDWLNGRCGTNYSYRFWKTIAYPWVATFTQIMFERQLMAQKFVDHYSSESLKVNLITPECKPKIRDTAHLHHLAQEPEFNHWAFSRILENIAPENWTLNYLDCDFQYPEDLRSERKTIKNGISSIIDALAFRCKRIYGMSPLDSIFFSFLLNIKGKINSQYRDNEFLAENKPDGIKWTFDYEKQLKNTVPKWFDQIEKCVNNKSNLGKIRLFSNDLYFNQKSKKQAALSKENGEIIIPSQHGGYLIGSGYINEVIKTIEVKQDYFISWGWEDENEGKVLPLPSPMLSRILDQHCEKNEIMIFMTTNVEFYNHRFNSGMSPEYIFEYRNDRVTFLKYLNVKVRKNVLYRPYPNRPNQLKDLVYVESHINDLEVLEGSNVHDRLLGCKLLVMDNPGTSVAIAMAANIPMILYFKPEYFPMVNDMKKQFETMEILKIYHTSSESASDFINGNFDQIQDWWNSVEVQSFRQKFAHKYARADGNWRKIWMRALMELK